MGRVGVEQQIDRSMCTGVVEAVAVSNGPEPTASGGWLRLTEVTEVTGGTAG